MKVPLIFVSGLLCNESVWSHQINHLNDLAAIKVICPNQNTPQKMVEEILTQSPEQFALAGHSMGGWLCLEVLRKAPERVKQLCLLNTTAKGDTPAKELKRHKMIQKAQNGQFLDIIEELVNDFVFDTRIKDEVRSMLQKSGEQVFISQEKSMLMRKECLTLLPSIRCPTLVIHADKDKVFSLEDHQELADSINHAKLSIIKDCGHMSPMEKPEEVTSLLRYWLESSNR